MIRKIQYIIFFTLIIYSGFVVAQDISFSQFYSNPLYLNPAFSGSAGDPRIALQYRNQWQSFGNAFTTYSATFDLPIEKLRGGIGLSVLNDAQANRIMNTMQFNFSYAVFIQLSEDFNLNGALQAGYNQNSLNAGQLIFADNLDQNYGNHGISGELTSLADPNFSFVDFNSGILIYSKRIFAGLAVHHLSEPNQSYYTGTDEFARLNRKYTAHFGARLPVYLYGHNRKKFDISPQLIVQKQGAYQQINYGVFATKRGLTAGAWFRQNFGFRYDAVTLMAGFFKKSWQFNYSYDWTVSGLRADSGGTSEISLIFLLQNSRVKKILPFFNQYEEEFGVQ